MTSQEESLFIVITNHKRPAGLLKLLESITKCNNLEIVEKIIVVENGSRDAEEIVASFKEKIPVSYHHLIEGNKSLSLNYAIEIIPSSSFMLMLDDDITLSKNAISTFAKGYKKYGKKYYYGIELRPEYEIEPSEEIRPYLSDFAKISQRTPKEKDKIFNRFSYALGACWCVHNSYLRKINGFNKFYNPQAVKGQETVAQMNLFNLGLNLILLNGAHFMHYVPRNHISRESVLERIFKTQMFTKDRKGFLYLFKAIFLAPLIVIKSTFYTLKLSEVVKLYKYLGVISSLRVRALEDYTKQKIKDDL
ncbi:MAG: glycosyltransferase family A protein [Bacteroidota bacterium]